MSSHADQHDLDKLGRWHRELTKGSPGTFPVFAIFLVSAEDRVAHDIFRKFRNSFEVRHAGFANLVIFGQHGISTTAQSLSAELGLSQESLPALALVARADTSSVYTLPLPPGASEVVSDEGPGREEWQKALTTVEEAADRENESLSLEAVRGVTRRQLDRGPLDALVGRLLSTSI
jgi:hypothetical protein